MSTSAKSTPTHASADIGKKALSSGPEHAAEDAPLASMMRERGLRERNRRAPPPLSSFPVYVRSEADRVEPDAESLADAPVDTIHRKLAGAGDPGNGNKWNIPSYLPHHHALWGSYSEPSSLEAMPLAPSSARAPIQAKAAPGGPLAAGRSSTPRGSDATGIPLHVRAKIENAYGADFSGVRIHTNAQHAESIGALAYTQGNDVHMAPGQWAPETRQGQALLGHELWHVVQQREGRVRATQQYKGAGMNDDAGLEAEADRMGALAADGATSAWRARPGQGHAGGRVIQRAKKDLKDLLFAFREINLDPKHLNKETVSRYNGPRRDIVIRAWNKNQSSEGRIDAGVIPPGPPPPESARCAKLCSELREFGLLESSKWARDFIAKLADIGDLTLYLNYGSDLSGGGSSSPSPSGPPSSSSTGMAPGSSGMAPGSTGMAPGSTGMAPGSTGMAPSSTGMAPTSMAPSSSAPSSSGPTSMAPSSSAPSSSGASGHGRRLLGFSEEEGVPDDVSGIQSAEHATFAAIDYHAFVNLLAEIVADCKKGERPYKKIGKALSRALGAVGSTVRSKQVADTGTSTVGARIPRLIRHVALSAITSYETWELWQEHSKMGSSGGALDEAEPAELPVSIAERLRALQVKHNRYNLAVGVINALAFFGMAAYTAFGAWAKATGYGSDSSSVSAHESESNFALQSLFVVANSLETLLNWRSAPAVGFDDVYRTAAEESAVAILANRDMKNAYDARQGEIDTWERTHGRSAPGVPVPPRPVALPAANVKLTTIVTTWGLGSHMADAATLKRAIYTKISGKEWPRTTV